MTDSRRNFPPGGAFFFTVNLAHTIRDDDDFARHVDYVHINPVKHRLVTRVRDWPHSSFHRIVKLGIYPEDWTGDISNDGADFGEPT